MGKYDKKVAEPVITQKVPDKLNLPPEDDSWETRYSANSRLGTDVMAIRADLQRLTADLVKAGQEYAVARRDEARKVIKAKLSYVKLYAETDKSLRVDDRKSEALLANSETQAEADIAEAETDALKMGIKVLSDALNACQTQCRLLRDELRVAGTDAEF
jgi:hypothetical protein